MILALDVGRTVGWALSSGLSGTYSTREHDDHGQALALFHDWLDGLFEQMPLVCLAMERGFGGNNANGRLTTAMELVAHSIAWAHDVPRTDRSAGEVRKWLVGVGRFAEGSKAERAKRMDAAVMAGVRSRGFEPANEHAADACALLCCVEQRQVRSAA